MHCQTATEQNITFSLALTAANAQFIDSGKLCN